VVFFLLVFALSVPFWIYGALTSAQLLPALPVSALGFICPLLAALILISRQDGSQGAAALLKRAFDIRRISSILWLLPVFFLEPLMKVLAFLVSRLSGVLIPAPHFSLLSAISLLLVFFIGGLGEELGWSGYVTEPLQEKYGALIASLVIGLVWTVWHYIPLLQAQRSPEFIAWWSLGTLSSRVIIVWLYNRTGRSVFAVAAYHAMENLTWQLYPLNGSFYDPRISGMITLLVVFLLLVFERGTLLATRKLPPTQTTTG
jgi:uncharacterized protein